MVQSIIRSLFTIGFVLFWVAIGKIFQYSAVAVFEPRLGFAGASLVGLTPFLAGLIYLKRKFPRSMTFRGTWQQPGEQ